MQIREGESVEDYMKRVVEEQYRESNIFCPYCNWKQDEETKQEFITYWGEYNKYSDQICYCDECNKKFIVNEEVTRTYNTEKIKDGA